MATDDPTDKQEPSAPRDAEGLGKVPPLRVPLPGVRTPVRPAPLATRKKRRSRLPPPQRSILVPS